MGAELTARLHEPVLLRGARATCASYRSNLEMSGELNLKGRASRGLDGCEDARLDRGRQPFISFASSRMPTVSRITVVPGGSPIVIDGQVVDEVGIRRGTGERNAASLQNALSESAEV